MAKAEQAEKVIFREEYNPYQHTWDYLAIFPEEESSLGTVLAVPFYFGGETAWFEPVVEIGWRYYYKTKIIHKTDKRIPKLLTALENYYGTKFKVMEKVIR